MIDNNVSLDLMEFVEVNILPRYNSFDKAHNLAHVTRVIRRSLDLARRFGADINMAYVIAAYHDLGLEGPRADKRLAKWFSPAQVNVMKEAVEDHRASASHAPRSLYGKIVAEADRDLDPEMVIRRTIEFGLGHYPEKTKEDHWQRFMEHMHNKYSSHGYIKLWLPGSDNENKLKQLRELINAPQRMRLVFDRIFDEEKN